MTDQEATAEEDEVDMTLIEKESGGSASIRNQNILNLPVQIVVSVGTARLTIQELMNLKPESVVELDAKIDDPADIYVGDRLIARGELVNAPENEAAIGIRLVQICDSAT